MLHGKGWGYVAVSPWTSSATTYLAARCGVVQTSAMVLHTILLAIITAVVATPTLLS